MATFRAFDTSAPISLSSYEEQALILRAVAKTRFEDGPVELEPGLCLASWEHRLLARESRGRRDVRGEALTLLRARAAELAVRRQLVPGSGTQDSVGATTALLDRTLADIGSATEFPSCENSEGLEAIARVLAGLYEQVTEASLRLHGLEHKAKAERPWRLQAVNDDEFEMQPLRAGVTAPPPTGPDDSEPSAFELEPAEPVAVDHRPKVARVARPSEPAPLASSLDIAADLVDLEFDTQTTVAATSSAVRAPRVDPSPPVSRRPPPPVAPVALGRSRTGLILGVVVAAVVGLVALLLL